MNKHYSMVGHRIGRLVVIEELPSVKIGDTRASRVRVRCDCGTVKDTWRATIRNGNTRSCGCLRAERYRAQNPDGLNERELAARRQRRRQDRLKSSGTDPAAAKLARMKW
jgi:hypothetical protein